MIVWFRRVLWFIILLPMTGCVLTSPPTLDVLQMRAVSASDEAMQVAIDVRMTNENAEPLEVIHVDYGFDVNGRRVFSARRAVRTTLGSNASHVVTIPAVIAYADAGWTDGRRPIAMRGMVRGKMTYIAQNTVAEVLLDTGLSRPKADFEYRAPIDLTSMREVTPASVVPPVQRSGETTDAD